MWPPSDYTQYVIEASLLNRARLGPALSYREWKDLQRDLEELRDELQERDAEGGAPCAKAASEPSGVVGATREEPCPSPSAPFDLCWIDEAAEIDAKAL